MQYSLLCRTLRHCRCCYRCINSICKRNYHVTKRLIILLFKFILYLFFSFSFWKSAHLFRILHHTVDDVDAVRRIYGALCIRTIYKSFCRVQFFPKYIAQASVRANERTNKRISSTRANARK